MHRYGDWRLAVMYLQLSRSKHASPLLHGTLQNTTGSPWFLMYR